MQEHNITKLFFDALRNGLAPTDTPAANVPFLETMQNLKPTNDGAVQVETVVYPPGALSVEHPWPQLYRGERVTLLLGKDTVSVVDESDWSLAPVVANGAASLEFSAAFSGSFEFPAKSHIYNSEIYICDPIRGTVEVFDLDGVLQRTIVSGENPTAVFVYAADAEVYVCDGDDNKIRVYNTAGVLQRQWGSVGTGNGQFREPIGICVYDDEVYVCDVFNERIQVFNKAGVYQRQWGTNGGGNGQFREPYDVAEYGGDIYVVDRMNDRVQAFQTDGTYLSQFGVSGSGTGQLNMPSAICVTDSQFVIADTMNNRLSVWSLAGVFVSNYGAVGTGNGQFGIPMGIAYGGNQIFVSDSVNSRVQIFDFSMSLSTVTGGSWQVASFHDLWIATNGEALVFQMPGNVGNAVTALTNVTARCVCNAGNRLVIAGLSGDWFSSNDWAEIFDCWRQNKTIGNVVHDGMTFGTEWVVWSEMGGGDTDMPFHLLLSMLGIYGATSFAKFKPLILGALERGEIGMMQIRYPGEIQNVMALGSGLAAYGDTGICYMDLQDATYSEVRVVGFGLLNRNAIAGNIHRHAFLDSSRNLWVWTAGQLPERLGYDYLFVASEGTPEVIVTYDPVEQDHWITDGTWCYVLSTNGLGGPCTIKPLSLMRASDGRLVGTAHGLGTTPLDLILRTCPLDFGARDSKTITTVSAQFRSLTQPKTWVEWRNALANAYKAGMITQFTTEGAAFPRCSFIDGKVVITAKTTGGAAVHAFEVRYQKEGSRFVRGTQPTGF